MKTNKKCDFTFRHYRYVIQKALSDGYIMSKLEDYDININKNKVIFLRHDVDFDISLALKLAIIEHKLGIRSTYFLRTHGSYNLFSYNDYKNIKQIMSMKHEIGLHHEGGFSILFGERDNDMIKKEKAILEIVTGITIKGIASHEAKRSNLNLEVKDKILKKLGFVYDAYSPKFTKEVKYISDSAARWREGCMCRIINSGSPKLCILTHPFWWYEKSSVENY